MPELFDDGPDDSDFSIPGDDVRLAAIKEAPLPAEREMPAAEAPVVETPAAEVAADTAPAAKDPETPPEPGADETTAEYLAKFNGDVDKALKTAAHAEALRGRQAQEVGELREAQQRAEAERQALAEQLAAVERQTQQQHVASQAPAAIETLLEQGNYFAAAEYARQANNGVLYQHVLDQWAVDQPFQASNYHTTALLQAERAQNEQILADRLAEIQQATQPLLANHAQSSFERDLAVFSKDKPDIEAVAPEMVAVAQENEALVSQLLNNPDPEVRQQGFRFLYTEARGRISDNLAPTAREIVHEQAQAADEAIRNAAVASAATVAPATTVSVAERIAADWDKLDAPYQDGWNV